VQTLPSAELQSSTASFFIPPQDSLIPIPNLNLNLNLNLKLSRASLAGIQVLLKERSRLLLNASPGECSDLTGLGTHPSTFFA